MNKIKPPYNINGLTQKVLIDALDHEELKNKYVQEILQNREQLVQKLATLPIVVKIFPSDANFILVRFTDSMAVFNYLINNKMILRDRSKVKWCDNSIRITVGTSGENDTLVVLLQKFIAETHLTHTL